MKTYLRLTAPARLFFVQLVPTAIKTLKRHFACFLMLFVMVNLTAGQIRQRIIVDSYLPDSAPVRIVAREIDGRNFEENRVGTIMSGHADANWFRDLTFAVKNVSKKNISYIKIELMVPKQQQMPTEAFFEATFGISGNGFTKTLSPGEVTKIGVAESEYRALQPRLEGWGVTDFTHLELRLTSVYFDDDTGWSGGVKVVRDPLKPRNWNVVKDSENNIPTNGILDQFRY